MIGVSHLAAYGGRMVYCLIYTSRSVGHVWLQVAQDIVRTSLQNNPRIDVTGCLCSSPSGHIQLLEGPKESVEALFAKIAQDPRHVDVRVSKRESVEARRFAGWGMAFAPRFPEQDPLFDQHLPDGSSDFSSLSPSAQEALLVDVVPLAERTTRDLIEARL